jgi:DNA-binding NarL/FixJ family response regulator
LLRQRDDEELGHINIGRGPEMKRLVIADHQRIVREGLKALLANSDSLEVVAEASDEMEAIRCVEQHNPDLLLINLSMPVLGGMSIINEIKNRFPATKILAISLHESEEFIMEGLQQGIDGYCLKDCGAAELHSHRTRARW